MSSPATPIPNGDTLRRILVIDDNDAIHSDFRKILAGSELGADLAGDEEALFGQSQPTRPAISFQIDSALQGQDGCELVATAVGCGKPYHLAFVDMRMPPGWDGVQTIEKLWEVDPNLQVVICTAYSDYSWEQIIDRLGVTDRMLILKKPLDEAEVSQLASALTAKWLVTAQARMKEAELEQIVQQRTAELKEAALVDKLTGLPNRALLNDRLNQLIRSAHRDPAHRFALLFLDFDRFKVVNDSLGHEIGDLLLVSIAERLRKATRSNDSICLPGAPLALTAARLGGDEFIVLLDQLRDFHDAARVTERLLQVLSEPYHLKGHVVHTSASIGITTSAPNYTNAEDMIRDADTAMYRAKAAGKARYVVFDQKMHEDAVRRLSLETDLRQAIDRTEFMLQYQPIISLRDGSITSFEALIRWKHPLRGMISPGEFIPLAEEIGAIIPIGFWVLGEACRQLADWRQRLRCPSLAISVNLSRKQLAAPDLTEQTQKILAQYGLSPSDLILEITESAIMEEAERSMRALEALRSLGIQLHMDDFGSGYSSLGCLHRFPLTGLKIDRAFIQNVGERRDYSAVVNAIVTLARNLGIRLVAEGVETVEQLHMLLSMGCDQVQGYHFARPMDPANAEAFICSRQASIAA